MERRLQESLARERAAGTESQSRARAPETLSTPTPHVSQQGPAQLKQESKSNEVKLKQLEAERDTLQLHLTEVTVTQPATREGQGGREEDVEILCGVCESRGRKSDS
jgi:hypothetical protein